jgi:hypothetical protein
VGAFWFFGIMFGIVAFVVVVAVISSRNEKKRTEAWKAIAAPPGMQFLGDGTANDDGGQHLPDRGQRLRRDDGGHRRQRPWTRHRRTAGRRGGTCRITAGRLTT